MKITIEGEGIKVSDGYHTIDELYEHRIALFIALGKQFRQKNYSNVWISKFHSDGSSFNGWFVMGINMEAGQQITYHLPIKYWDNCQSMFLVLSQAPEFDGHNSNDVLERLSKL